VLIVLLPFSEMILAKLWAMGLPASVVHHLGAWKEALAIGVILAGARNFIATGRRADALDRLGLAFVGVALLYLALQHTILPSAPSSTSIRLLGFREDAGFVVLLLGARHAPLPANFLDRAGKAVLIVATVVAAIGLYEAVDSAAWNRFVVHNIQFTRYQASVLNTPPVNFNDIRIYGTIGGTQIIRIGSVFLSALSLGFYLVLGFAAGLERAARGQARLWLVGSLLVIVAALVLTQTRSAIPAALVVAILVLQPAKGRSSHWRVQLALVLAAIAIMAVPVAFSSGLSKRVTTNSSDNAGHVASFWQGLSTIGHHPLGDGLGTSAGTGQRYASQVSQLVVPENTYLQVGVELGIIPMLVFTALTLTLIFKARAAARRYPHYMVAGMAGALAGLAVGAWFLQPWTDFSLAWTAWGLTGAALGVSHTRALAATKEIRPKPHPAPRAPRGASPTPA
jgi:hypothetical protein